MDLPPTLDEQQPDQSFAMDSKLYVVFYMKPEKMGFKSEQEGRPIFEDRPHVKIYVPGDKTTIIDVSVTEEHKMRFAKQWEKFEKMQTQSPEGTPLEEWPQLTGSQVMELKAFNVYTVEQLAGLSDGIAQKFMGNVELRRKAKVFLEVARETAAAQRYATENAELLGQVEELKKTVEKLGAQVEVLQNANPNAPSAPSKRGAHERTSSSPAIS